MLVMFNLHMFPLKPQMVGFEGRITAPRVDAICPAPSKQESMASFCSLGGRPRESGHTQRVVHNHEVTNTISRHTDNNYRQPFAFETQNVHKWL